MDSEVTLSGVTPPYSSFGAWMKRYIVFTAAGAGLFSSLSAQIYFPSLNVIAEDLNVSNSMINLTVTSYMIFQGIAPMFLGSFADQTGRRPAYIICFTIYIASNIGLALQDNYAALIVLRCMQASGISSTVALSAATVADVATKEERGSYMGLVMAGNFMGPAIGPIIGGLLSQYLGWRSTFWFLVIAPAAFLIPLLFFLPETARNVVGDGSEPAQSWNKPFVQYMFPKKESERPWTATSSETAASDDSIQKIKHKLAFPNPLKPLMIVRHPNSIIILLVTGVIMAGNMTVLSSITQTYTDLYGLNELKIGLCYIAMGCGSIVASVSTGRMLDWNYKRMSAQKAAVAAGTDQEPEAVPIEKARAMITIPLVVLGALTTLAFGWVLFARAPLAAPEVILFFVGIGQTGGFISTSTLLVDLHTAHPAAATAANNFVRSLFSAGASAVIDPMLSAMGRGWTFTLVACVLMATIPFLLLLCGMGRSKKANSSVEKQ